MDEVADNYNPQANIEDGSCLFPVMGCRQGNAQNYNPNANIEDGSCIFEVDGAFNENEGEIDDAIDPFLDGNSVGEYPQDGNSGGGNYGSTNPVYAPTKQAGFTTNPLLIIGALAVAGIVIFMANRRPAPQIAQ